MSPRLQGRGSVPILAPASGQGHLRASVAMSCRLSPQRCVPQDTSYSSLFLKVLMQTLQWLDSPGVDGGPLQAQLRLFAAQYSARRRISDGEGTGTAASPAGGGLWLSALPSAPWWLCQHGGGWHLALWGGSPGRIALTGAEGSWRFGGFLDRPG